MKARIILLAVLFWVAISDGRADWVPTNGPGTFESVIVFAVSGPNLFAGIEGGGVYLSPNNGTSWTAVNTGLTDGYVRSLAFSGPNLFAGTYGGGVFLSTNNGSSWTQVFEGVVRDATSLATSGANVIVGTHNDGVFFGNVENGGLGGVGWLRNVWISSFAVKGEYLFAGTVGFS